MKVMEPNEGGFLFIYPLVWRGNVPSMTNRYQGLVKASGGLEPPEEVKRACVEASFSGAAMPSLEPWVEKAKKMVVGVVGAGYLEGLGFVLEMCKRFPEKVVLSWHDPLPETHREEEKALAFLARWHVVPTRAHSEHLRGMGAQGVYSATPLLDDLSIPRLERSWSHDIGHLGWVGGKRARDIVGLAEGIRRARRPRKPWRVIQYGPLPRRFFLHLLPYRAMGVLAQREKVPREEVVALYSYLRIAAVLQKGGFYGELCIPGKLIEAVMMGCPPLCDRRGALLARVCDEAELPSWNRPSEIPEILEVLDGFYGEAFARRLGFAIAECSFTECFARLAQA